MATYKSSAGAILQPGNQINRLSGYNDEGVFGWPGVEAFELVGYAKVSNLAAAKACDDHYTACGLFRALQYANDMGTGEDDFDELAEHFINKQGIADYLENGFAKK